MARFKTILFGNLEVTIELDSDGMIETVSDEAGNELELHDVKFMDPKHPAGEMYVDLQTLLYDKISEAMVTHNIDRYNYDYGRAVRDRRNDG